MKLIKNLALSLLGIYFISCGEPDLPFETFEELEYGAYARNLKETGTYNVFDLTGSSLRIEVEFYDENKGKNVASYSWTVAAYFGMDTISAVNLMTIDASSFVTSANGLPGTTINLDLESAVAALGIPLADITGGEVFLFSSMITKTDGSTFDASNTGSNFGENSFLAVTDIKQTVLCIPETPISGDYTIKLEDTYGDGWQGSEVIVRIDEDSTTYSLPNKWNIPGSAVGEPRFVSATAIVTVPVGTDSLAFIWSSGDFPSECKVQIFPPSGSLGASIGPSPKNGEISIDLCNE